jgi:demethylmenaquinone methyltransferase/2-methoxy-6-polyprenyl-1,4-benzoquinol methylase
MRSRYFRCQNFEFLEDWRNARLLKPGGKLVILEFSKPNNALKKFAILFRFITPGIGKLISKTKTYQYLDKSMEAFPGENFVEILKNTGYINTYRKPLSFGICTIYCGSKK